jgi:hypothetical protein
MLQPESGAKLFRDDLLRRANVGAKPAKLRQVFPERCRIRATEPERHSEGASLLYMIIETFRGGAAAVYERVQKSGRLAPLGLHYVASWVTLDGGMCFQVMECADPTVLDEWMAAWNDLVDFSVTPVMTSADAAAKFTPA